MNRRKFFFKKPVKKTSPKNIVYEPSEEYKKMFQAFSTHNWQYIYIELYIC